MDESSETIIIDIGTDSIKAGFKGDYAPLAYTPTIVGRLMKRKLWS